MSLVPKLSPPQAQKLIQRAWRDIRDSRLWSFLTAETTFDTVEQITAGTVTVTNGLAVVTGDATAFAAWDLVGSDFTARQFRAGTGPIYNIVSYTSPDITLNRPFAEPDASGASYSIYKCYYPAPVNFLRFISVFDPIDGYPLDLDRTKAEIDRRDPLRGSMSQPVCIYSYKYDISEAPLTTSTGHLLELYPHPIIARSYPALYQKRGVDFASPTETIPDIVPDEVLMMRAKYWAYEWAAANSAAHPELRGVDWPYLRRSLKEDYERDLFNAQKQDEEIFQQNYVEPYTLNKWRGPAYDGNYALSHAPYIPWRW